MSKAARKARQKARSRLKREARRILTTQYGVDPGYLNGYPAIRWSIAQVRPELNRLNGYDIMSAFTGLPSVPPKSLDTLEIRQAAKERKQQRQLERRKNYAATDAFLESYEWRRVRMEVLKKHGARCQCCGATPADGVKMHVDHIKPRKRFPDLALDINNLQVLCEVCNHGKGNWDQTDWRGDAANDPEAVAHIRSIVEGE